MKRACYSLPVKVGTLLIPLLLAGCGTASNYFNPFYEPPSELALQGQLDDSALNEGKKDDVARKALEQWGSYERKNVAQPVNPVLIPAIVRLMWVPDHLNRHGDLVPAHYYYVRVLNERWNVDDAFELDAQLNAKTGSAATANVPYVWEGKKGAVSTKKMR